MDDKAEFQAPWWTAYVPDYLWSECDPHLWLVCYLIVDLLTIIITYQ